MSPIQSGEPSNAQAALIASVDRMRRRKDSEKPVVINITSTSAAGVIRNSISRRQNVLTPYCASKASPSRSKRAEPTTTRQKNIRTAAGVKSRSPTPSSSSTSSSAPGTPQQQTPPRFPALSTDSCVPSSIADSHSVFCSDTRTHIAHFEPASCDNWAMQKEVLDPPDLESENEEILREMFAKYTNFDMSGSEVS